MDTLYQVVNVIAAVVTIPLIGLFVRALFYVRDIKEDVRSLRDTFGPQIKSVIDIAEDHEERIRKLEPLLYRQRGDGFRQKGS